MGPEDYDPLDVDGMPPQLQFLESDKTRESQISLRSYLVEALILLCSTREGRSVMRDRKVYPILRELDAWEGEDSVVREGIDRAVNMLCRDEPMKPISSIEDDEKSPSSPSLPITTDAVKETESDSEAFIREI